jgi:peptide/nickel transport system permease protein
MGFLRFSSSRLVAMVVTLLISSFIVYAGLDLAPGTPLATLTGGRPLPPDALAALKATYHLQDSFFVRYLHWLADALHGRFGQSLAFHQDVGPLIGARAGTTVLLVVYGGLLTMLVGIPLGMVAAVRGRRTETFVIAGTSVAVAVPSFLAAVALIYVFGVRLSWFPVFGSGSGFTDKLYHLTLPAVALALTNVAYVARLTRAAAHAELSREHVQTARARGLPERLVIRRHVLRNALIPILTVGGVTVASLMASTVVVENAFSVDGLGSYLVSSVESKDFAPVQAICLIFVAAFVLVSTLLDVVYGYLDPTLRRSAVSR